MGHVPDSTEHAVINSGYCNIPHNTGIYYVRSVEVNGGYLNVNSNNTLIIRDADPLTSNAALDIAADATCYIHGKVDIAEVNGFGNDGIRCNGNMQITGIVNIDDVADVGIDFFAFANTTREIDIRPSAKINIKNCKSGIVVNESSTNGMASFVNDGFIKIDSIETGVSNEGIYFRAGHISNTGVINIGKLLSNQSAIYIFNSVQDSFVNESCGRIYIQNAINGATMPGMINNGYLYQDFDNGTENNTDFVNNGFIQHNLDTFNGYLTSTNLVNNGYILGTPDAQYYVGIPISPALDGMGIGMTIPGNQFYTDATLTVPAGLFNPNMNTWTPNAAAQGLTEIYLRVQTDTACTWVMKITYEMPIAEPNVTGSTSACDFSNGKPTLNEVEGNACVDGVVNVSEAFQLTPVITVPTNPAIGYIYMDGNTNTLRYWNGGNWVAF